jgi:Flp pilus assembly protein TadG
MGAKEERPLKKRLDMLKRFRLLREERGSGLVEFAIVTWVVLFLSFAIIRGMLAMYAYHFTITAAQQGSRFAMVRGYTWSEYTATNCSTSAPPNFTMVYNCTASATDIQNYVQSLATMGINAGNITITTTSSTVWPGETVDNSTTGCTINANSEGCMVKVIVSYPFQFLPNLGLTTMTMTATSEKVILQ